MKRFFLFSLALIWCHFLLAQTPNITCPPSITVNVDPGGCTATVMSDLSATSSDHFVDIRQTAGVQPTGSLWAWGSDQFGELGNGGSNTNKSTPVRVGFATDWVAIAAGGSHSLGIRADSSLWAWGSDQLGQLGDGGSNTDQNSPVRVGLATDWIAISAGRYHSMGIRADGSLWAWGSDEFGQLGNGGSNTNKSTPVRVGFATDWIAISARGDHSMGIRADGSLWAWGSDQFGQLGDGGSNTNRNRPVRVGLATNWIAITAGWHHSMGIRADGSLWAWGNDRFGRLGDGGSNTNRKSPVRVGLASDWVAIAAGASHSMGIRADGSLWAWGWDLFGQLGDGGSNTNQNTPVRVGLATDWVVIIAGANHSMGIQADSSLWAWGDDGQGRLGDGGSNTDQNSPVQVGLATDWIAIVAGFNHSLGIQDAGYPFPLGSNTLTFEARDGNGNTASCSFTVTVEDNEAPTATCQDATVYLDATGKASLLASKVDNGSSDNCSVSLSVSPSSFGCGDLGGNTVTLTVSDMDGNSSHCTATITVEDTEAPTITCPPSLTVDVDPGTCAATVHSDLSATASDNCGIAYIRQIAGPQPAQSLWAWGLDHKGQLGIGMPSTQQESPVKVGLDSNWVSISAGEEHSLGIRSDSTLWAWGSDQYGQLGDGGGSMDQTAPVQVGAFTDWIAVSAGRLHSLGIRADSSLWAWGLDAQGQLGNGSTTGNQYSPVKIGSATDWIAISAGSSASYGIRANGSLWAWGSNGAGQLGIGAGPDQASPVQVGSDLNWVAVAGGFFHCLALKANGTLWAWGRDVDPEGYLGLGTTTFAPMPQQVGSSTKWVGIAAGRSHSLGLQADGSLWAWGSNDRGRLGLGSSISNANMPTQVGSDTDWAAIAAGGGHSLGLQTDGTRWAWGFDGAGQLGNVPGTSIIFTPAQIGLDTDWVSMQAGASHSLGLRFEGYHLLAGTHTLSFEATDAAGNTSTCAFTVTVEDTEAPTITCPPSLTVDVDPGTCAATVHSDLSASASDNCGIAYIRQTAGPQPAQSLWAWGRDHKGQLGNGLPSTSQHSPVKVGLDSNWVSISAGEAHSLGIRSDSTLWAWGSDQEGQLGDGGSSMDQTAPVQVGAFTDWIAVSAGTNHSLGIRADSSLWAWGDEFSGRLGNGSTTGNQYSPVKIGSATDWIAISAGSSASYGIRADGSLWAWGSNVAGQLGIGAGPDQASPVQVGSDLNWVAVAGGENHCLALKANGTLWAWGKDFFSDGYLGLGTTTSAPMPQQVGSGTQWVGIAASRGHSLGLQADGSLWAWGSNDSGLLGLGSSTSNANMPTKVGSDTDWAAIAAGSNHSLGLQSDGTRWAWGVDGAGQLGNGSGTSIIYTPAQIGSDADWVNMQAGASHSLGLRFEGYHLLAGTHTLSFEATDAAGNTSTCAFTVTVEDNEAPTAICQDATVSLNGNTASITAQDIDNGSSDNCSVSLSVSQSSFGCGDLGGNTVTLTVSDMAGNSSPCTATVTVEDNEAPTASCQDATVSLNGSTATIAANDVNDGSSDNCSVSLSVSQSSFGCGDLGGNTVTLTVSDMDGNSSQCTATVTVEDNEAPTASCQDATVSLNGSTATIAANDVNDGSSDNCSVSLSVSQSSFGCGDLGGNTVTLTVSDMASNSSQCTATVTVEDNDSPSITCPTTVIKRNTDLGTCAHIAVGNDLDPAIADNCSFTATNDLSGTATLAGTTLPKGKTTVTWTATDAAGNSTTCTYDIRIRDREAPVFDNCPDDSTIIIPAYSGGSYFTFPALTATDNCNSPSKITISGFPLSGSFCAVGVTTFNWTATDKANNVGHCNFDVTVQEAGTPAPNGWSNNSVGNGNGCHTNYDPTAQSLTLQSAGGNVNLMADNFCGITIPNSDQAIDFRARVTPPGNGFYDQAGIMMRQSLASNAKHATMLLTGTSVPMMTMRASAGGFPMSTTGTAVTKPYWLRLYRLGGTITGYISADGVNWTTIMSYPNLLSSPLYLVLFSTTSGPSGQATFTDISINGVAARLGDNAMSTDLNLKAYPNPFSENLFIEVDNALPGEIYQVRLSNMLGQRVYGYETGASATGKIEQRISLEHLAAGTYLLEVSAGVQRKALKVVKQ